MWLIVVQAKLNSKQCCRPPVSFKQNVQGGLRYYTGAAGILQLDFGCQVHYACFCHVGFTLFDFFSQPFSNSLIIHQVKTKEIITVTVVWICDLNKQILYNFSFDLEDISNTRECFITFPNTWKFVRNTPMGVLFFSNFFLMFGNVMKHLYSPSLPLFMVSIG